MARMWGGASFVAAAWQGALGGRRRGCAVLPCRDLLDSQGECCPENSAIVDGVCCPPRSLCGGFCCRAPYQCSFLGYCCAPGAASPDGHC